MKLSKLFFFFIEQKKNMKGIYSNIVKQFKIDKILMSSGICKTFAPCRLVLDLAYKVDVKNNIMRNNKYIVLSNLRIC